MTNNQQWDLHFAKTDTWNIRLLLRPLNTSSEIETSTPQMKLIVTGATGFVGGEVIRQALRNPAVTSVVALARKPYPTNYSESSPNQDKLQWVILEDWTSPYPEAVKDAIKNADACIWSVPTLQHLKYLTFLQGPSNNTFQISNYRFRRRNKDLLRLHHQQPQKHDCSR